MSYEYFILVLPSSYVITLSGNSSLDVHANINLSISKRFGIVDRHAIIIDYIVNSNIYFIGNSSIQLAIKAKSTLL